MIILGIDPGVATTGYGVIKTEGNNKWSAIDYGCILTSPKIVFSKRLSKIFNELKFLIEKYKPEKIVVEKIYFAKNVKTAFQVGEARGVIVLTADLNDVPICELTPLQVKQALTGYGQASKQQIQKMVKLVLKLKEIPKPDDAADALAIAMAGAQMKNFLD